MKWNYLSDEEAKMKPELVDLQIVLGLQSCKTKKDVMDLLQDVRQHERLILINRIQKRISDSITKEELEKYY